MVQASPVMGVLQSMNKIKSIYATQPDTQDSNPIKESFENFRNKLDAKIKDTIITKKTIIVKQSSEYLDKLNKIREQANKYKKKIYEQEKEFEERVENHIKFDIKKWSDYQGYFKDSFEQLEQNLQHHRQQNRERQRKIDVKRAMLKDKMHEERSSHSRVSSLIKLAQERSSNKTTKESSVANNSRINRVKTQASLPALKPSNRIDRIKTIYSDCDEEDFTYKPRRVMSYMEPIGVLREKQASSFPILIDMLRWYKSKQENNVGDNWFLKLLFSQRNFSKLTQFMQKNSSHRRVTKKL